MGSDILREIVAVEKEIQQNLDAERKRIREWLDKVKREAEEEVAREEERFRESCATALEEAKAEAERKAAEIVKEASARADIFKGLDGEHLRKNVIKHMVGILPGGYNDRQDLEG